MMKVIFFLACLFLSTSSFANEVNCTDKFLSQTGGNYLGNEKKAVIGLQCQDWVNGPQPVFKTYLDGTIVPSFYFREKMSRGLTPEMTKDLQNLKAKSKPSPAQKQRVFEVFTELKKIAHEKASKDPLISSRLKRLTLKIEKNGTPDSDGDSEIRISEEYLNYPWESLVPILSHEISHSLDPCHSDYFIYNQKMAKELKAKGTILEKCDLTKHSAPDIIKSINEDLSKGVDGIVLTPDSASTVSKFLKCGFVHRLQVNNPRPFMELHNCMSKYVKTTVEILKENDTNYQIQMETDFPSLKGLMSLGPKCDRRRKEAFADALGAQLTVDYISKFQNSLKREQSSQLLLEYAMSACSGGEAQWKSYPSANDRISFFLQHPEIQRVVGCKGLKTAAICSESISHKKEQYEIRK